MSDPPRLLDATDNALIAEMLSAAREQAPRASSVKSTLLAVGSVVSVMGAQASASAAAGASGGLALVSLGKLAVKWTVLGVVVVGGGVASVEVAPMLLEQRVRRAEQAQQGMAAGAEQAVRQATKHDDLPQPEHTEAVVLERKTASRIDLSTTRLASDANTPQEHLKREVALLDEARRALSDGRFQTALMLSTRYLQAYPSGRLEQEARYLKMRAQRELGDAEAARREAERLLELNPLGPHAEAARDVAGAKDGG